MTQKIGRDAGEFFWLRHFLVSFDQNFYLEECFAKIVQEFKHKFLDEK